MEDLGIESWSEDDDDEDTPRTKTWMSSPPNRPPPSKPKQIPAKPVESNSTTGHLLYDTTITALTEHIALMNIIKLMISDFPGITVYHVTCEVKVMI